MTNTDLEMGTIVRPTFEVKNVPPLALWQVYDVDACHYFIETTYTPGNERVIIRTPKKCVYTVPVSR